MPLTLSQWGGLTLKLLTEELLHLLNFIFGDILIFQTNSTGQMASQGLTKIKNTKTIKDIMNEINGDKTCLKVKTL